MEDNNTNCLNIGGCRGCRGCRGCYGCYGCRGCRGCDSCYGCYGCYGCIVLYKSLFCKDLQGAKFMLFNKQSTESRVNEVSNQIYSLWNGWRPYQTNAFDLYKEAGQSWAKIDLSKLTAKDWDESWKDMPKESLVYIANLPEFDPEVFISITGIELDKKSLKGKLAL